MPPQAPLYSGCYARVAPVVLGSSVSGNKTTINPSNIEKKWKTQLKLGPLLASSVKTSVGKENWGYPGYLDEQQAEAVELLQKEAEKRGKDFQDTIFTNRESNEDKYYALCRWLRYNKFNVNVTIRKVEEALEYSSNARQNFYYHHPTGICHALGVEPSIYLQYCPQFYYGSTKLGLPIFYAKAGIIDTKAIGCVSTIDRILQFHWHDMYHQRNHTFKQRYKGTNGTFKRYEILYILDLKHLSTSQLNKQILNILRAQFKIDELCFPDSMMKMIIINAPSCFPLFWRLMKTWVDARTSSKVEVFGCNKDSWEKRIYEFVEKDQLPSDFGGLKENGSSVDIMRKQMIDQYKCINSGNEIVDEETHLMLFHNHVALHRVEAREGLKLSLSIYTNSKSGGLLQITDENGRLVDGIPPKEGLEIIHESNGVMNLEGDVATSTLPTKYDLKQFGIKLDTPGWYDVKISLKERLRGNFLLVSHYSKMEKKKEEDKQKESTSMEFALRSKPATVGGYTDGLKSYSLGIGTFSLVEIEGKDNQVQFYPSMQSNTSSNK